MPRWLPCAPMAPWHPAGWLRGASWLPAAARTRPLTRSRFAGRKAAWKCFPTPAQALLKDIAALPRRRRMPRRSHGDGAGMERPAGRGSRGWGPPGWWGCGRGDAPGHPTSAVPACVAAVSRASLPSPLINGVRAEGWRDLLQTPSCSSPGLCHLLSDVPCSALWPHRFGAHPWCNGASSPAQAGPLHSGVPCMGRRRSCHPDLTSCCHCFACPTAKQKPGVTKQFPPAQIPPRPFG